ncbi:hypothetical protein, partial [Vibrio parahaemolyticus]|uniref:hypothetical protein n=1 Tax=Vibrio parahaemolyticus TaxID=670 RepID=UPI001E60502D
MNGFEYTETLSNGSGFWVGKERATWKYRLDGDHCGQTLNYVTYPSSSSFVSRGFPEKSFYDGSGEKSGW